MGNKTRGKCEGGVTDSEGMALLGSIMCNGRGLKKDVLVKRDLVLSIRSRTQGLQNVYKSFKKV